MFGTLLKAKNWIILSVSAGIIILAGFILILDLPALITKGNQAQKAIQMLDEMRRPFLAIEFARTRLLKTSNPELIEPEMLQATESAKIFLIKYRQLAEYNPEVAKRVDELRVIYDKWIVEEWHLLLDYKKTFLKMKKNQTRNVHII